MLLLDHCGEAGLPAREAIRTSVGDPDERSTVVTAIELPTDIDGGKVPGGLYPLRVRAVPIS
jgi:hypothetical protein